MSVVKTAVVGLGKMGLSHHAIINAHPDASLAAVCDSTGYILDVLNKYTGVQTFTSYEEMLQTVELDAVIIATPSTMHVKMVRAALDRGLHVFCEKPFCLEPDEGELLVQLASNKRLVTQVGYHNRFVAAFEEVKRLLDISAIGRVTHLLAEAYGPVVLKPTGSTWRTRRSEGGGCLYDYAAHPINLATWYLGQPKTVAGTVLGKVFSTDTDDEVYSSLLYADGTSAQLSVNWSDESFRKMTTKITIWGTAGRIYADRQEVQAYLRDSAQLPGGYQYGWNVRYTTDLTTPVWYYLRGEEYSAQIDCFLRCIQEGTPERNPNTFKTALETDRVISMLLQDSQAAPMELRPVVPQKNRRSLFFRGT